MFYVVNELVHVNIEIMRAFVKLRQMLATNEDLARKLAAQERKYDAQFKVVFEAIRELMVPPEPKKKRQSVSVPGKKTEIACGAFAGISCALLCRVVQLTQRTSQKVNFKATAYS